MRPFLHLPTLCRNTLVLAALWLHVMPAQAQDQTQTQTACPAPPDYEADHDDLSHVAAALAHGHLAVLAIGSATLTTPPTTPANGPAYGSFPYRMVETLRLARPGAQIDLTVRSGKGLMADDMLNIIRTEMAHDHYQLVIWQTGTVEAVRNTPPDDLYDTVVDGASFIHDQGAELILVDPQYSRFLQANTDLEPYRQSLQQAAALPGVLTFQRFELMRYWAETNVVDLEHLPYNERTQAKQQLHLCLGQFLARQILENLPPKTS